MFGLKQKFQALKFQTQEFQSREMKNSKIYSFVVVTGN